MSDAESTQRRDGSGSSNGGVIRRNGTLFSSTGDERFTSPRRFVTLVAPPPRSIEQTPDVGSGAILVKSMGRELKLVANTLNRVLVDSIAIVAEIGLAMLNKCENLSVQAHFYLLLGKAPPPYITEIMDLRVDLNDLEVVEMSLRLLEHMMKTCTRTDPMVLATSCVFGPVKFVDAFVPEEEVILPESVGQVLVRHTCALKEFKCNKCNVINTHDYAAKMFKCSVCFIQTPTDYTRKDMTTYTMEMFCRAYLIDTMSLRVSDLIAVLSNIKAKRVLIPGDAIGFGAIACTALKIPYLSVDASNIMQRFMLPGVSVHLKSNVWLDSQYKEGDVYLISHIAVLDPEVVVRNKGRSMVVYEPRTIYIKAGVDLFEPVAGFSMVKVTSLELWKGCPIRLSTDDRRAPKFPVMTKYYDETAVYYTQDSSCLRMLNYYSSLGKKVRVLRCQAMQYVEDSLMFTILDKTAEKVTILYKKVVPKVLNISVLKYINVFEDTESFVYPMKIAMNWPLGVCGVGECIPHIVAMTFSPHFKRYVANYYSESGGDPVRSFTAMVPRGGLAMITWCEGTAKMTVHFREKPLYAIASLEQRNLKARVMKLPGYRQMVEEWQGVS